jgi:hypothetical protein
MSKKIPKPKLKWTTKRTNKIGGVKSGFMANKWLVLRHYWVLPRKIGELTL